MAVLPANSIQSFAVTVPAGTLQANAVETFTTLDNAPVVKIELLIPSGHAGLTGIAFLLASGWAIPAAWGTYVIGDDDRLSWDMTGQLDSGAWSVSCFNTDIYPHTFYLRYFQLDAYLTTPEQAAAPALPPTPVLV